MGDVNCIKITTNMFEDENEMDESVFVKYAHTLAAKNKNIPLKELFWFLRLAMMGKTNGPGIHELVTMLGGQGAFDRIERALNFLC